MSGPSVLIVDDHAGFRSMARALLTSDGFDVVGEAADGHDAIQAVARLQPDVVVLDVRLPDLDGFEVTRRLLAGAPHPAVVLVSTRDAADYGRQVATSGALGFIPKSSLSGAALAAILQGSLKEEN